MSQLSDVDSPSKLTDGDDAQLGPRVGKRLAWTARTTSRLVHDGKHHGVWGDFVTESFKYQIAIQHLLNPDLMRKAHEADFVDDPDAYEQFAGDYVNEVRDELVEAAAQLNIEQILERKEDSQVLMKEPPVVEQLAQTAVKLKDQRGAAGVRFVNNLIQMIAAGDLNREQLRLINALGEANLAEKKLETLRNVGEADLDKETQNLIDEIAQRDLSEEQKFKLRAVLDADEESADPDQDSESTDSAGAQQKEPENEEIEINESDI